MGRRILKTTGWVILALITLANAGYLGYSLKASKDTAGAKNISLSTIDVKSSKQRDVDATKFGVKSETGEYKIDSLKKSRIDSTSPGKLVLATQKSQSANFILATNDQINFDTAKISSDWTTTTVADDPLWAPGACSAKPTLLLQGKYIFIDDGKTKPTDTYNSFVVYDIAKGTYNYFGGDNFSDTQAKREKILFSTNENDQLVFYIDELDKKGPLTDTTSFKHATGSDNGYIIRRVVDPETMKYTDYHLKYSVPQDFQYFYLSAFSDFDTKALKVQMTTDSVNNDADTYSGSVVNNEIVLHKDAQASVSVPAQAVNLDSPLEKELEGPLSTLIPKYASEKLYDTNVNSTHYAVTPLGVHKNITFGIVGNRSNEVYTSPLTYDQTTKQASVLTDQEILSSGNFVALGVF